MNNYKNESPIQINNYLPEERYLGIMSVVKSIPISDWSYQAEHGRYLYSDKWLDKIGIYEIDNARKIFNNDNLLFTYSLLSFYNGNSGLEMHTDDNACTYTLDICLYAKEIWPLIVENKSYDLNNNDALCYYGEDQVHGRPEFKEGNEVLMMFLHFADKNHWWFQANNRECT